MDLKKYIAIKENWPKHGISFKDITPLLQDADAFEEAIIQMAEPFKNVKVDKILCADARGFIFGAAIAYYLHCGVIMARKPNKLPFVDVSVKYDLEYGSNTLEIAPNAIKEGESVLIVDDLLATGGSSKALTKMCRINKANLIGYSFLIELTGLHGKEQLDNVPFISLLQYEF